MSKEEKETNNLLQAIYNVNFLHGYYAGLVESTEQLECEDEIIEIFEKTIERLDKEMEAQLK